MNIEKIPNPDNQSSSQPEITDEVVLRFLKILEQVREEDLSCSDMYARLDEFPNKEEFVMETTTGNVQHYERFGSFSFEIDGQTVKLTIYRSEHGFFLPFVDSLAGTETYPAGRYLEPDPLPGGRFFIDFNLAYNPYCAYNDMYSCPITPSENRLKVPIRAGEKLFTK